MPVGRDDSMEDLVTLTAESDRTLIRSGAASTRYVRLTFTAPAAAAGHRRLPLNVSLVLDRSGSMGGGKFELARKAAHQAFQLLKSDDRFSVVVYDSEIDLIAASSAATAEARRIARNRLAEIEPRGSTNLSGGWLLGCEQVGLGMTDNTIGRCLLLTDGLANEGITDPDKLTHRAGKLRGRGIATSTFGIGADFDERLLQAMAEASGGHFYYLEEARQIPEMLASEMGEALEIVARGAVLRIEVPAGVSVESLNSLRARPRGGATFIELDDLVSGQEVEVVLGLTFPRGQTGDRLEATISVADRDGVLNFPAMIVDWAYASHAENDRQPRNRGVDRAVATQYAARARMEATERNRSGDLDGARKVLRATAARIRQYADGDEVLTSLAQRLEEQSAEYSERAMTPMELKGAAFLNYAVAMNRSPEGRARRAGR